MGDATGIQWTDATWNPARGCSRVSDGCRECFAMRQAHRFSGAGQPYDGLTTIRRGKVDWVGKARLHPEVLSKPLRWKKPQRIFVNSMSDLFHESLTNEEIAAVFGVMAAAPQHTFQVLTKRPKRMLAWFEWIAEQGRELSENLGVDCPPETSPEGSACVLISSAKLILFHGDVKKETEFMRATGRAPWPLPNVHVGVSVEDQQTADERIPLLLATPAAVRFISAEPLLGPVDLDYILANYAGARGDVLDALRGVEHSDQDSDDVMRRLAKLDWVIVGGESGPSARVCEVAWIRRIVSDCQRAGVPVFVKQLGARARDQDHLGAATKNLKAKKGDDPSEWPEDLRVRELPEVSRG